MIKITEVLAVCAFGLQLAVAAQVRDAPAEGHAEHQQHAGPSPERPTAEQSMATMQAHMLAMREQMAGIHASGDPVERQRLMHEHMQSMQQHAQMMDAMRTEQHGGSGSGCAEDDARCRMEEMRERMGTMEDRLESMQQLMRQMMEHLDEAQRPDEP